MNSVVATGGKFEIIHADHINLFSVMYYMGKGVNVYLNSDKSILEYIGRPALVEQEQRRQVLLSIYYIHRVYLFDEPRPHNIIKHLQPAIWCKGGDYDIEKMQSTPIVRGYGGEVITIPHKYGIHSSDILEKSNKIYLEEYLQELAENDEYNERYRT